MSSRIKLLDLIEKKRLDELLEGFTEVSGISSFIVDPYGQPISDQHNWTTLCSDYCRSTAEGRRRCYKSDRYGGEMSAKLKRRFIYPCLNAGIIDCTSPIIVGTYHIATFMCGQVLHKPIDEDIATQHAHRIGIRDITGYIEALRKIPVISNDRLNTIVNFMEVVTRTVSELALSKYISSRQSRQYLERLINRLSDGIISIDAYGRISMVNKAFSRFVDEARPQIIGQHFTKYIPDEASLQAYDDGLAAVRQTGSSRASLIIANSGQKTIPVQLNIAEIRDEDGDMGFVAVVRDMSEEARVAQLKEDLIGMLTHDLGNPIFAIQKAMQIFMSGVLGPLSTAQEEIAGLTMATAQQLSGMVMDYLDIYRYENGKFRLRKELLDMRDIIKESIKQTRLICEDLGVNIRYEPPPEAQSFMGDRMRLLRICLNLLGNAIKCSPNGSEIEVRTAIVTTNDGLLCEGYYSNNNQIHRPEPGQKFVLAEISDQGPGVPREFQNAIFNKFFSLKHKDPNRRSGVGLGLAFCRLAAESHNGFIWVKSPIYVDESSQERGSRFYLAMPAQEKISLDSFGLEV